MGNPWLEFLKQFRKKHPGLSMKEAMKKAAVEWKSVKGKTTKAKKKTKTKKKKMKKKTVTFDELEGGAIRADTKVFESAAPAREDFTTVMRGSSISQFEGDSAGYFNKAFDLIPKNMYPMFQYEQAFQGSNPVLVRDTLLKGVSGLGAHKDAPHIAKAVVHSLKKYPKLLHAYLNSRNVIPA